MAVHKPRRRLDGASVVIETPSMTTPPGPSRLALMLAPAIHVEYLIDAGNLDDHADTRTGEQADTLAIGDGRVGIRRPPDIADRTGHVSSCMNIENGEVLAGETCRRTVFVNCGRPDGKRRR